MKANTIEVKAPEKRSGAPGFWRLNAAAEMAGVTPEMFKAGVESGQIPVRCVTLGKRQIPHVHVRQFLAWMEAIK